MYQMSQEARSQALAETSAPVAAPACLLNYEEIWSSGARGVTNAERPPGIFTRLSRVLCARSASEHAADQGWLSDES